MNHRKSMFQVSGVHYIELKATVQTRHQLFCREDGKCHEPASLCLEMLHVISTVSWFRVKTEA